MPGLPGGVGDVGWVSSGGGCQLGEYMTVGWGLNDRFLEPWFRQ